MSPRTPIDRLPEELTGRRVARRLVQLGALGGLVALVLGTGPDLDSVRDDLRHADLGWLAAGAGLELLSALSYVVVFRAVFSARMGWRDSYRIGMAEQAANSVLPVSGAGGLALGAWALSRAGMSPERIGRRTVAFFFLTSLANVVLLIVVAALSAAGVTDADPAPAVTYGFGAAALAATVLVLGLPRLLARGGRRRSEPPRRGRAATAARYARDSLTRGIPDGLGLLRRRPVAIASGSAGFLLFDIAVLGVCFRAFGYAPPLGVLLLGYVIGQLGGNVPLPGGVGGVDAGLIGTFALYHQPLAATAAAVLLYHAIALWVPGLLGGAAFVQLRRSLRGDSRAAIGSRPVADTTPAGAVPAVACRRAA